MLILEVNPLLLAEQGIGINTEYQLPANPRVTFGTDLAFYAQNPYDRNTVVADRTIYSFAPKVNYYLYAPAIGPFIGFKVFLNAVHSSVHAAQHSMGSNIVYVAPSVHLGYRVTFSKITLSAFAGIGMKSRKYDLSFNDIPASEQSNPDWHYAVEHMNHNVTYAQADYGIALGTNF